METQAQDASGYYVWEAAGKGFEIHVHLDVIDAILAEMMRGFGAVPKRGAEVGGLLLGSIERGDSTIVRIEDFETVECGYTRGPSYLFSAEERETFDEACARWRPEASRDSYAVGFYRSHTRDGMSPAPEDIELMDRCFPGPADVALLVKPFATKASQAGFFFREAGVFQDTTPLEFPFRRCDLTGEDAPERRPLTDRRQRGSRAMVRSAPESESGAAEAAGHFSGTPGSAYSATSPARSRMGTWMSIPLSFIFLLLGVALGYLALNVGPRGAAAGAQDYSLSLAVLKSGDSLLLEWNGESPVIRKAERGVLEIHDGGYAATKDLDFTQLRSGRLTFHNSTDSVNFHLTVYLNANLSVSENLAWHQ
jgi:hypothetical protein